MSKRKNGRAAKAATTTAATDATSPFEIMVEAIKKKYGDREPDPGDTIGVQISAREKYYMRYGDNEWEIYNPEDEEIEEAAAGSEQHAQGPGGDKSDDDKVNDKDDDDQDEDDKDDEEDDDDDIDDEDDEMEEGEEEEDINKDNEDDKDDEEDNENIVNGGAAIKTKHGKSIQALRKKVFGKAQKLRKNVDLSTILDEMLKQNINFAQTALAAYIVKNGSLQKQKKTRRPSERCILVGKIQKKLNKKFMLQHGLSKLTREQLGKNFARASGIVKAKMDKRKAAAANTATPT